MGKTINVLTQLDTLGVSLVRRGANRKKFAITKSEDIMDEKSLELLSTVLKEAGYDGEDKIVELVKKAELDEKEQSAIKGALRLLNAFRDNSEIKKLADMLAQAVGYPMPKPEGEPNPMPAPTAKAKEEPKMDPTKYPEPMAKALEALPVEQRGVFAPVLKAMWEGAAAQAEAASAERIQKAEERATKTEEILKSERDSRLTKEFIAKSATEYGNVPGKSEELGVILKSLHDLSPDLGKKVESVLKAADAALKEGAIFVEKGRGGEGTKSDDPWTNIEKAAEAAGVAQ